ncbi:hypothetical protein BBP40_006833 [Aspergillus hancockii]|nr:hypothetical protein BBP40_006833 [Aspergillus hancockii]
MSERKRIRYAYEFEAYQQYDEQVTEIIKADTGEEVWVSTRSYPPICFPPPLTTEAIDRLKTLEGVQITELEE